MSGLEKFMGMNNTDIENDTEDLQQDQLTYDRDQSKQSAYNITE
jgi:hypothetical protein